MENNNKKNIIIIILLSIIIALLIVGGLFLFNVITFKNYNNEQPKPEENNAETKYDIAEAEYIINSFKLESLIERAYDFEFGKNILESEANKSTLVKIHFSSMESHNSTICKLGQPEAFILYSQFANKYKELFGKDFKFIESESQYKNYTGTFYDGVDCEKNVCTSENIDRCYFTFNNAYLPSELYNLVVENISNNTFSGKVYVSKIHEPNSEEALFGNFEFKYNVDDNNNIYIESLIINK